HRAARNRHPAPAPAARRDHPARPARSAADPRPRPEARQAVPRRAESEQRRGPETGARGREDRETRRFRAQVARKDSGRCGVGARPTVRLSSGLQVDLRVIEPACFGAALQYFTGSQAHNIELRKIAQAKKLKLNEYGLYRGSKCIGGRTEEEVYAALGLDWIPPELREGRNEIALAREHRLPALVTLEQIRGDLQMHTDASDGKATMAEMVEA